MLGAGRLAVGGSEPEPAPTPCRRRLRDRARRSPRAACARRRRSRRCHGSRTDGRARRARDRGRSPRGPATPDPRTAGSARSQFEPVAKVVHHSRLADAGLADHHAGPQSTARRRPARMPRTTAPIHVPAPPFASRHPRRRGSPCGTPAAWPDGRGRSGSGRSCRARRAVPRGRRRTRRGHGCTCRARSARRRAGRRVRAGSPR